MKFKDVIKELIADKIPDEDYILYDVEYFRGYNTAIDNMVNTLKYRYKD